MAKPVRLHKYIAGCGYCSRRHAEKLIEAGLVEVNARKVSELGTVIDPEKDTVTIHGQVLRPPERRHYIMLNKPREFITSTHDTHERLTVMDLIPQTLGVYPVGRLDLDTEGLLLLTNDGEFSHRVMHPRYGHEKEYTVEATGKLTAEEKLRLEHGVVIDGKRTSPCRIEVRSSGKEKTEASIILTEGRKRQVKRMFESVGHKVISLKRVRVGPLELGNLQSGKWRELTPEEVKSFGFPGTRKDESRD